VNENLSLVGSGRDENHYDGESTIASARFHGVDGVAGAEDGCFDSDFGNDLPKHRKRDEDYILYSL